MPSVRKTQKKFGGSNSPNRSSKLLSPKPSSSLKSPQLNKKITKCSDLAKFSLSPIRQECMKKCHDPYKTTNLTNNNNKKKFKNSSEKYATCVQCLSSQSQNDTCKNLLDPDIIEKKRRTKILNILEPTHQFRIDLTNLYARLDESKKISNLKEKTYLSKIYSNQIKILEDKIKIFKPKNSPTKNPIRYGYATHSSF